MSIDAGDYTIVWAEGHLLTLMKAEDYDDKYATWSLESLPIYFEDWKQKIDMTLNRRNEPYKKNKMKVIGDFLKRADSVIHAGDPDDEGQLIVDEILRWFNYKGPVKRLETANTTKEGLERAMSKLKDNTFEVNRGLSAYARSVADLMVGINLSRYFSLKNAPAKLAVGRVQTPTLGMVYNRDMMIEGHEKVNYYVVSTELSIANKLVAAKYALAEDDINGDENGRILSQEYANQIANTLNGMTLGEIRVTKEKVKESPPLPFNLVKLQTYCSKKFGYDPSEVMKITQSLRDNHRAITYNRSDCQYLSMDEFRASPSTMATVVQNIRFSPREMDMTIQSRCFNDSKISAHTAIIPQNQQLQLDKLTKQERDVYLAICKYYMAQFMPPAQKRRTKLVVQLSDGGTLTATSTEVLSPGYLAIFSDAEKDEIGPLSELEAGTYSGTVVNASVAAKETRPPSRYTLATLNEDMTRISKYVKDPVIKQLLLDKDKDKEGENGSIGTSATRESILSKLVERGFLEVAENGKIKTSPLARAFIKILPSELKEPDMTAFWWAIQEEISNGESPPEALMGNVLYMINNILVTEYPKIDQSVIPSTSSGGSGGKDREVVGKCPRCGNDVVVGEKGFGCSNWKAGCKFVIWKKQKQNLFSQTSFTKTDAKAFLAGKTVKKTKLLKNNGETFEASVKMDDDPTKPYVSFNLVKKGA